MGIRDGVVVITKCDMADPDWIDMVQEDIAQRVKGTFLEGKPVFRVSAATGEGIPELKAALKALVAGGAWLLWRYMLTLKWEKLPARDLDTPQA